ncbi:hypothetical protein D3C77_690950 [compost metagenome]
MEEMLSIIVYIDLMHSAVDLQTLSHGSPQAYGWEQIGIQDLACCPCIPRLLKMASLALPGIGC